MVDVSKIRVGDEITVRMTVRDLDANDAKQPVCVRESTAENGNYWPFAESIVGHVPAPRPIVVGSIVKNKTLENGTGKVLCLHENRAWVEWCDQFRTFYIGNLVLADDEAWS